MNTSLTTFTVKSFPFDFTVLPLAVYFINVFNRMAENIFRRKFIVTFLLVLIPGNKQNVINKLLITLYLYNRV